MRSRDGIPEGGSRLGVASPSGASEQRRAAAERTIASSIVWDNVWPLENWCGNDYERLSDFEVSGYTAISLTLAGDNQNIAEAMQRVAAARRQILSEPQRFILMESVDDATRAVLACQRTPPFFADIIERNTTDRNA